MRVPMRERSPAGPDRRRDAGPRASGRCVVSPDDAPVTGVDLLDRAPADPPQWARCGCGGRYDEVRFSSCFACYVERTVDLVVCLLCGRRRHHMEHACCYACRAKYGPTRDDATNALRQLVHHRDRFRCTGCGRARGDLLGAGSSRVNGFDVDHIVPCRVGGRADEWNLRLLCRRCNSVKGGTWFLGCRWEDVRTTLCRRYWLIAPTYFPADEHARFRQEVAVWRRVRTWDPVAHAAYRDDHERAAT